MRGLGGSTLRGGQTVFHGLRMWGQLVQAAMMLAAFMVVAVPAWNLWRSTAGAEWYAAGMYTLAEVKLVLGYEPESGQEIRFPDGTRRVLTIREIASSVPAREARERIKAEMFASAWLGAKAGLGVIALFLAWFWYRGVQLSRRRRIRGAELVTAGELRRRVRPVHLRARDRMPGWKHVRPYSIAGVPYPERTETQHTIVSGTTGSGKTVLISDLVAQIRARGERCVIYDKMGGYTAAFFDAGRDVLMNPLDARAPRWSPFLEARNPRDFDMMAAALISASAARTLEGEAGIGAETLQRFLARYAGVAAGRMTAKGEKEMRAAFAKTVLVVDEGSLASTVQARDLLRIADSLRIPRVVLVGDEKQLDAVDAGKPFAQLQAAGMKTAVMDQIMRQRDPALKEAVEASLAGDIARAFEKLGDNVAEVNPDNLAGAAAARWLALPPEARERTGLMAPSHALREGINGIVRERLTRDGVVHGPAMQTERLVSRGYTNAEKALARNYMTGDVVGFHRPYKRLGVEKGDELRVAGVDRAAGTVALAGKDGGTVAWEPGRIAARAGGVEVYKRETMELRAGDRIRWTRNDAGLGLVNSQTAEVAAVNDGRVSFRLDDGRMLDMNAGDPQLRHIDRAWASTVHAFQGRTVDNVIAAIEANHPNLTNRKMLYVEISRAPRPRRARDRRTRRRSGSRSRRSPASASRRWKRSETGSRRRRRPRRPGAWDAEIGGERGSGRTAEPEKTPAPKSAERDLGL